jgi:hypothetical protein
MPTRKQRRRRAKDRRHDYEYVYVDEEGNEVDVEPDEASPAAAKKDKQPTPTTRAGRRVEPPSLQKVGRRALIFAPLMFLTIRLLEKGEPIGASLARTVFLLAIFLPFSYLMDAMIYRSYRRRAEAGKR